MVGTTLHSTAEDPRKEDRWPGVCFATKPDCRTAALHATSLGVDWSAMPRNIEIKARVSDATALEASVQALATDGPYQLTQHDTFYEISEGRLKLRRFDDGRAELIYYMRPDSKAPAASEYLRVVVEHPSAMEALLTAALRVRGEVKKTRRLYWIGRTRVHLDKVQGLGDFMELEVTLPDDDSQAPGEATAFGLMDKLGIAQADLIEGAYLDLLLARQTRAEKVNF